MILVTGGTGMAGSFIVRELHARGHAVRVLARPDSADVARDLKAELAIGDLADAASLRQAAAGVQGIVHVACTFSNAEIDVAAMKVLLDAWDAGPFIFISSLDVYGYPKTTPITEDHPLDPAYTPYAGGKVKCEGLLAQAASEKGRTDYAMLRAPYIWGPHTRCRERLVDARLQEGRPIVLPGANEAEWSQYRDAWVDTRELAWIVAECLARPLGGPGNVVNSHFTWHDMYSELIRLTGSKSKIVHKSLAQITAQEMSHKQAYAQTWLFSGELVQQRLGFKPARRWQDTLAEIVAVR
jgi:nucleoside-diphosphate-sugar epimerase